MSEAISETRIVEFDLASQRAKLAAATRSLAEVKSEAVLVLTAGHEPRDDAGVWDAMLLFEMHTDIAAAAGRITDRTGKILSCCTPMTKGSIVKTWTGMYRTDPGDYAMALKQQTVTMITPDYFFCRVDVLREAVSSIVKGDYSVSLADRIGSVVRSRGMRLAYSPLIEAIRSGVERPDSVSYRARQKEAELIPECAIAALHLGLERIVYFANSGALLWPEPSPEVTD